MKQLHIAIGKSMLAKYAVYVCNVASMMLLARLFSPASFGAVASVSVFSLFFQLLAEGGLGPAIINLKKLSAEDRNGLFGLTFVIGVFLSLLLLVALPALVWFYKVQAIAQVVPFVAVALLFYSISIVPAAILLRDQAFARIASAGLLGEVFSTLSSACLLLVIPPIQALAAKVSISAATNFFWLFHQSRKAEFGQPGFGWKFGAIKELLSFSSYQFGFNVINYFSRNLDNILVGRYMGSISLGVYDKAYQLMRYPLMLLTYAMSPAIQPVLRQYSTDLPQVEAVHRDFAFKLSLIGACASVGIFLLAKFIVIFLLGEQWMAVVPLVRVLSIAIPVQVVLSTSGSFFQATNRADELLLCGVLTAIVMVAAILWGVAQHDLIKLSWALVVAFHINFFQAYVLLYRRVFKAAARGFFFKMAPILGLASCMAFLLLMFPEQMFV